MRVSKSESRAEPCTDEEIESEDYAEIAEEKNQEPVCEPTAAQHKES
jgi:hypothetical protein